MNQYIYILSNPSMPGLVKIGKTTTSPDQRVLELHTTGVPTPFVLELSVEVDDCTASERAVHLALQSHRVANNREFFQISVAQAVEGVLSNIGYYKIHKLSSSHGIRVLEEEIIKRRQEGDRKVAEIREEKRLHKIRRQLEYEKRISELKEAIAIEKRKLSQLGQRPSREQLSTLGFIFAFPIFVFPFGIVMCVGALFALFSGAYGTALFFVAFLVIGYMQSKIDEDNEEKFRLASELFSKLDERIKQLEDKLVEIDREHGKT